MHAHRAVAPRKHGPPRTDWSRSALLCLLAQPETVACAQEQLLLPQHQCQGGDAHPPAIADCFTIPLPALVSATILLAVSRQRAGSGGGEHA